MAGPLAGQDLFHMQVAGANATNKSLVNDTPRERERAVSLGNLVRNRSAGHRSYGRRRTLVY
jgi:hypothetical protein